MHRSGVAHRDLKPSNVLLDKNLNVRVTDFGLGSFFGDTKKLFTPCGSPCFAAPEVISGNPYQPEPYDMWGLGVILFNMLTGTLPFDAPSKTELYSKINAVQYMMPDKVPILCKSLIRKLLVKEPHKRVKMEDLFKDEWIQKAGKSQIRESIRRPELKISNLYLPQTSEFLSYHQLK